MEIGCLYMGSYFLELLEKDMISGFEKKIYNFLKKPKKVDLFIFDAKFFFLVL